MIIVEITLLYASVRFSMIHDAILRSSNARRCTQKKTSRYVKRVEENRILGDRMER
jgi:hypothetical protein